MLFTGTRTCLHEHASTCEEPSRSPHALMHAHTHARTLTCMHASAHAHTHTHVNAFAFIRWRIWRACASRCRLMPWWLQAPPLPSAALALVGLISVCTHVTCVPLPFRPEKTFPLVFLVGACAQLFATRVAGECWEGTRLFCRFVAFVLLPLAVKRG